MSNTYILKYARDDRVKYVSHLDFVRLFQRATRRAGIEFQYSQGFNPHPIMTVARPLSVGVTAEEEYLKVGFEGEPQNIMERLNEALPDGYKITYVHKLLEKEIDVNLIDTADYEVLVELVSGEQLQSDAIDKILAQKDLTVPKKTKSGVKDENIREHIYSLAILEQDGNMAKIAMSVTCDAVYNLKPETVLDAISKYANKHIAYYTVNRKKLYIRKGDKS